MKINDYLFKSNDNNIVLEISEDKVKATITILENRGLIDEKDILDLIMESGISYGFEKALEINRGLEKSYGEPFLLALGEASSPASVEFTPIFGTENNILTEDNYDIQHLKNLEYYEKDTPVAHFFISKEPTVGTNIFGKEDKENTSEEDIINKYLGENVTFDKDQSKIFATRSGYPYLTKENKVSVKTDFIINKDFSNEKETFYFKGNLTINGTISNKTRLKINGDIIINGDVNDSYISADGSIIINGMVSNCNGRGIISTENIAITNAENSKIVAAKNIYLNKNAHFCRLISGENIIGNEESSSIVGGIIQSGGNIEVAIIGNPSSISTEIEITISPYIKEKMMHLTRLLMKLKEDIQANENKIIQYSEELQSYENQLEADINKALLDTEVVPKHIMIFKKIFPGTYLRILKKARTVTEEMNRVTFSIENNELVSDEF